MNSGAKKKAMLKKTGCKRRARFSARKPAKQPPEIKIAARCFPGGEPLSSENLLHFCGSLFLFFKPDSIHPHTREAACRSIQAVPGRRSVRRDALLLNCCR